MEVKDIVKPAVIVSEGDSFETALKALTTQHTNTLLVVNDDGELSGEVTVADMLDAVIPSHLDGDEVMAQLQNDKAFVEAVKNARDLPVADFMSVDYSALELGDDLMAIVATAITHQRARIPVVNKDNRPVGIVSRQGLKQVLAKFMEK